MTERWQEMLNSARLAFAVMTRDDAEATDDVRRARQNVIHEIGLCHARLGVFDTIILTAEGIEEYTNIAGVVDILFQEGRLEEKRNDIEAALMLRRIL